MDRGPVHEPVRPSWCCAVCPEGTPWPCPPGRVQLAETYVGELLPVAGQEAGITDPHELYERFVSWTWVAAGERP